MSSIEPMRGFVIVRRIAPPSETAGGILLPDQWKRKKPRKPGPEPTCGVIEAVTDGSCVGVGDKVVYLERPETWCVELNCRIVPESDLLTRVEWDRG